MYRSIAESLLEREALFEEHPEIIYFFVENISYIQNWRRTHRKTDIPHLKGAFNKDLDEVKSKCLQLANEAFGLNEDELIKLGIRFPKKID